MKQTFKRVRIPLPEKAEKVHNPKKMYRRKEKYKKNVQDLLEDEYIESNYPINIDCI